MCIWLTICVCLRRNQRDTLSGKTEAFKKRRNAYRSAVRKAKRNSWRNSCSAVEDMPQASRIYKILGKFNQPLDRITVNGVSTCSPKETLEVLLETHFPGGAETQVWDLRPQEEAYVQSNVTIESTIDAINQFQPFRSPGPDGFPPLSYNWGEDG